MLLKNRCTVCHDSIESGDWVICGECNKKIHRECAEFERQFNCLECADEPEIGAVDF